VLEREIHQGFIAALYARADARRREVFLALLA
jgi:hypothetical protein